MILFVALGIFSFILVIGSLFTKKQGSSSVYCKENDNIPVLLFAFFALLFVLTAFRSENIGKDTKNYIMYFLKFRSELGNSKIEIGYQILCNLIGRFTDDPHIFFIIVAAIEYIFFWLYIRKYCRNSSVVVCLFYCTFFPAYLSMMRQGIAMLIVLYAYQFIKSKRPLLSFFLILLATTFHKSALIALLFFFSKFVPKKVFIVLLLTSLISIFSIVGILTPFIKPVVSIFYSYFDGVQAGTGWLATTYSLLRDVCFFLLISSSLEKESFIGKTVVLSNFALMLIFISMGYMVNNFDRASEYFLLIAIFELPDYVDRLKNASLFKTLICSISLAYFIVTLVIRPEWTEMVPYSFWN